MGFIAKAKERFGKAALALAAGGVLGTVALASLATGDVSAATGAEAEIVETTRWLGLSVLGWIGAGLTAAFGVGTLYFRDIRLAGATIAMVILTGLIVHFGLQCNFIQEKNTNTKRIAAISLVAVLCLSSFAMFAPAASAASDTPWYEKPSGGYIAITFDDGHRSDYEIAFPNMTAAGIPGTSFVVTNSIDNGGMTSAELLEMEAAGWEIGSHSAAHKNLANIPIEDAINEMVVSKATLENIGLTPRTIAYPFGGQNEETRDAADDIYELQRGILGSVPQYLDHNIPTMRMVHACKPSSMEKLDAIVEGAIATNTVAVVYWHGLDPSGGVLDANAATPFTIHDVIDYISEKMETDGLTPIRFCDLIDMNSDNVVEWTAVDNGLASVGANWAGGVAPTSRSYLAFTHTSKANCTLDTNATYQGLYISPDYRGQITVPAGVTIKFGTSGMSMSGAGRGVVRIVMASDSKIICKGHSTAHSIANYYQGGTLQMTGDGTHVSGIGGIGKLHVSAHVTQTAYPNVGIGTATGEEALRVDEGSRLTLSGTFQPSSLRVIYADKNSVVNNGIIDGDQQLELRFQMRYGPEPSSVHSLGDIRCNLLVTMIGYSYIIPTTMMLSDDVRLGAALKVTSSHATSVMTVAIDQYNLTAQRIVIDTRGEISGDNGTITVTDWDSTNGIWSPGNSTVILRNGGSALMAPGQKFNDIQIASDDGRTATWYMNATGTINPVITGLNSGNYLWYLDGVEQGELTADANGTIALSYESTGLHELSVVGQWEDPPVDDPVDGIPSLVGYGWVIAGLAGCAALAAYIMGYRHPVVLAIAAILLIAAALMHYGVL